MEEAIKTWFPSVHGEGGELIELVCFADRNLRGTVKALNGIDDTSAQHIIGAARFGENNAAAGQGILVNVSNPQFSGRSYALALALADKILRHGARQPAQTRIIATGRIEPDGCGTISAIEGINAKLRLILQHIQPGDIILFPEANLDPDDDEQQSLLKTISAKDAQWKTLNQINDAENLLWGRPTPDSAKTSKPFRTHQRLAVAATLLTLVSLVAIALMLWQAPKPADKTGAIAKTVDHSPAVPRQTSPVGNTETKLPPLRIAQISTEPTPAPEPITQRSKPKEKEKKKPEFIIPPVFIPTDQF